MEQFNLAELKESLTDFHREVNEMIENDPDYDGEADDLLAAIGRVQNELSSVNTEEEMAERIPLIAEDLMFVMRCAEEFAEMNDDDEDEDEDEFDLDDEFEDEDEDSLRMEFDLEVSRFINRKCNDMFFESSFLKGLNKSQQEHAPSILDALSAYTSEYLLTDYHDLFVEDLEELCFDLFPGKFYSRPVVFNDVPAVLMAFFNFLGDKKLLDDAAEFVTFIEGNQEKIVELLSDEDLWSFDKKFFMDTIQSKGEFDPAKIKEQALEFYEKIEMEQLN